MNAIQTFNFHSKEVRTATDLNGDVYFCLTDVADVLEISNANPSRFNLDEAGVHKMYTPTNGGDLNLDNLQFLSWFENRCKNNMTQAEWNRVKENIGEYLI